MPGDLPFAIRATELISKGGSDGDRFCRQAAARRAAAKYTKKTWQRVLTRKLGNGILVTRKLGMKVRSEDR